MSHKNAEPKSIKKFFFVYFQMMKLAWKVKRNLFVLITFMGAFIGMLMLPTLYIDRLLIDTVLRAISTGDVGSGINNIALLVGLNVAISFVRNTWRGFEGAVSQTLARLLTVEIQVSADRKINLLPVSVSEDPQTRDLFKKITDMSSSSAWLMLRPLSGIPYSIFTLTSALIALSVSGIWFILASVLFAIPGIFVGIKNSKIMHKMETELAPLWRVWNAYEDFLTKGRYIYENKILGHANVLSAKVGSLANEVLDKRYQRMIDNNKRNVSAFFPAWIFSGFIRAYFYIQAIVGKITLGTAQMQSRAIGETIAAVNGLGRQINDIYENYLFVKDYTEFMNLHEEEDKGEKVPTPLNQGVEFKNVWFKYPHGNRWILKGVNFKVDLKDNIAIVGKNGAGKTTIIKLLCGFYSPQKGEVLVNGKKIEEYSPVAYKKIFSALFQDFAQYPFSSKESIGFGDVSKVNDIDSIKRTAKLVGIDDFIESLPKKYNNALDNELEGGIEPSKGQWQKLALARTLFRKAEIFILDEPTSNVDPEAEEEIFNKILEEEEDKIVILVSHRFSTVRKADKILLLENGLIAEYGSHEQLMTQKGKYHKLFSLQAKSYDVFNSQDADKEKV